MKLHVAGTVRMAPADFGIGGGSKYNSWFDRARAATMSDSVHITFEVESWRTDAGALRPPAVDAALQRIALKAWRLNCGGFATEKLQPIRLSGRASRSGRPT